VVTEEDFGLVVGKGIAEKLQFAKIDLRETQEMGELGPRLMPYLGPVRVVWGAKEAFVGAINCGAEGVLIGKQLVQELQIVKDQEFPATPALIDLLQERSADFIMTQEGAVDEQTCKIICDFAVAQERKAASVAGGDPKNGFLRKDIRDCYKVDTTEINSLIQRLLYDVFSKYIEPFFGVAVEFWEPPQMLLYTEGGKYTVHADAARWVKTPDGGGRWERTLDRDISLVMYLNSDFTGGMLEFPAQKIKIKPKLGMVVAFPSTAQYRHAVETTESGERLALVTWATVKGSPRVREKPGPNRVYMDDVRL
jgi:predicted 2-oxoglutarate/Fe(II)-dependent dioxygenase YbiX